MSGKVPDPPPTPPRGGAHKSVSVESMAERAKDEAHDAVQIARHADDIAGESLLLSRKHADIIETIPAMHVKLDLALRPRPVHPIVQGAIAFGAVVAACALVTLAVLVARAPSASAAMPSGPGTQAVYRAP